MNEEPLPHVHFPGRQELVFLPEDEIAYANLLTEAFPNLRFIDDPGSAQEGDVPPEKTCRSVAECRYGSVFLVFDPSWEPVWRIDGNRWYIQNPPYPNGDWSRGGVGYYGRFFEAFGRESPETICPGRIYFRVVAGDKAHASIARKALRLMNKIANNKRLNTVRPQTMEMIAEDVPYGPWVGHHARRWCLETPDRCVGGTVGPKASWAWRPMPDST